MTVLNDTNIGRVQKMVETIALLKKSADSNKASQEELWQLMTPAIDAMQTLLDPEARPAPAEAASEGGEVDSEIPSGAITLQRAREALAKYGNGFLSPDHVIFKELARQVSLDDAYVGLHILIDRLAADSERHKP